MAKWVDIHGGPSLYRPPSHDATNERLNFDTGDNYASDIYPKGIVETDFLIEVDFWSDRNYPYDATIALISRLQNPGTSSTHYYLDFSHGRYDSPGITVDSWTNGERSNTIYSEPSDYYWSFGSVHTFVYAVSGNTQKFWWNREIDQPPNVAVSDTTHTGGGRLGISPAQARGWWDNLLIRKYLEPEPSVSLQSEENLELDIDHVLKVQNLGSRSWRVRLRAFSEENIERLGSTDIYIHDGTESSSQIIFQDGEYVQSVGDWFDLAPSGEVYIAERVLTVIGGTSVLDVYLEILVPGTSRTDLLTVRFRIY
jgi:hypothetical protein